MIIRTAGLGKTRWGEDIMEFDEKLHWCGNIKNGVSFDIGHGCWIISYEDLMKMAIEATQYRLNKAKS